MNRGSIARKAFLKALRLRNRLGYGLDRAICVFDLAQKLGVEVRFLDLPSLEGMYLSTPRPHIIISSLRPAGRRAFTCAHELGHHTSGDGTRIDEFAEQSQNLRLDLREFAADCFAGALLMPKMAVEKAFADRGWTITECTPEQIFEISNYFGVGYTTLIYHLRSSLLLLSHYRAEKLLKIPTRSAQNLALGWETTKTAWIVDRNWKGRSIDVEKGDLIFVRGKVCIEGRSVEHVANKCGGRLLSAIRPGIARLEDSLSWSSFIRVSKQGFIGRDIFRHQEEIGYE